MSSAARRQHTYVAIAVFVATLLPFLPALRNGFVGWDDISLLVENRSYRGFGTTELQWMFTDVWHGPYQPLAWLSYAVDHAVWGMDPTGFHLSSMLLHALAATALFGCAARLLPVAVPRLADRPVACLAGAALAALLWGVHPLRVEAVAWASARRDVLSALFLFLSLGAWLRHVVRAPDARSWWKSGAYWGSLGLYAAALLSKATPVGWPLVLLLLDAWPLRRGRVVGALAEKLPFVVLAGAATAVGWVGQEVAGGLGSAGAQTWLERLTVAGYSASFYVVKSVAPIDLRALYVGRSATAGMETELAAAALATVALSGWFALRRRPVALAVAWFAYLFLLAPVSGLVPVGAQVVADRFSYLAAVPLCFAVAAAWAVASEHRFLRHPRARVLALVCLLLLGSVSWRLTRTWRSTETLFGRVIAVDPGNSEAYGRLGAADMAAGRLDRAAQHFESAVRYAPDVELNVVSLAGAYLDQRRPRDAFELLQRYLADHPGGAPARSLLGVLHLRGGDREAGRRALEEALSADPDHVSTLLNLGGLEEETGRYDEAERLLRHAVVVQRGSVSAQMRLARFLADRGRAADAEVVLRAAIDRLPGAGEAHLELGLLLRGEGREDEARLAFARALESARASGDRDLAAHLRRLLAE